MVWRNVDKLTAQEKYKALGEYGSDLSKKTAQILEARGLGKPLENAKGFDEWRYDRLEALQTAADIARLELLEASNAANQAAANGQANQNAAGLSVGQTGATTAPATGQVPMTADGKVDFDKMRSETQQRAEQLGVTV